MLALSFSRAGGFVSITDDGALQTGTPPGD